MQEQQVHMAVLLLNELCHSIVTVEAKTVGFSQWTQLHGLHLGGDEVRVEHVRFLQWSIIEMQTHARA